MGMPQKIYKRNRANKVGLIPDKMQIAVNIKAFNCTAEDFRRLRQLTGFKSINAGFEGQYKDGQTYRVTLKYVFRKEESDSFINIMFYADRNGHEAYRTYYELGEPASSSTNGKTNFVTFKEIDDVVRNSGKNLYRFTIDVLPEILMDEFRLIHNEALGFIVRRIKAIIPGANIVTRETKLNTFSLQLVEMANSVPTLKSFNSLSEIDGSLIQTHYDPTQDPNVLANLQAASREVREIDWEGETRIAASTLTYFRGSRQIRFNLYKLNIEGQLYLKHVHDVEFDQFRVELTYQADHFGGSDSIYAVAGRRSVSSAEDIRKILLSLTNHTHQFTADLLDVRYGRLNEAEQRARLLRILSESFHPTDAVELAATLLSHHFKINIPQLPRRLQDKIRSLAKTGHLFTPLRGTPRTGDYAFKRKLLGN